MAKPRTTKSAALRGAIEWLELMLRAGDIDDWRESNRPDIESDLVAYKEAAAR